MAHQIRIRLVLRFQGDEGVWICGYVETDTLSYSYQN
jgi:hypothetical protein